MLLTAATNNTYTVTAVDLSKQLSARVSFADQSGSISSVATIAVKVLEDFAITFEQLTDITAPTITASTIHLIGGTGRPTSTSFTIAEPEQYEAGSIKWYFNGNQITGSAISGDSGEILTVSSAASPFNNIAKYFVTVEARKNGILYSKVVTFEVRP